MALEARGPLRPFGAAMRLEPCRARFGGSVAVLPARLALSRCGIVALHIGLGRSIARRIGLAVARRSGIVTLDIGLAGRAWIGRAAIGLVRGVTFFALDVRLAVCRCLTRGIGLALGHRVVALDVRLARGVRSIARRVGLARRVAIFPLHVWLAGGGGGVFAFDIGFAGHVRVVAADIGFAFGDGVVALHVRFALGGCGLTRGIGFAVIGRCGTLGDDADRLGARVRSNRLVLFNHARRLGRRVSLGHARGARLVRGSARCRCRAGCCGMGGSGAIRCGAIR